MFCSKCGTEFPPEGGKFCPNCGANQQLPPDQNAPAYNNTGYQSYQAQQPAYHNPYQNPPQNYYGNAPLYNSGEMSDKSRIVGGVLGIVLGAFGVHNFYAGKTGKAIAQLLITLLSLGILSPVSAIWGLVDGIMMLTDKNTRDGRGRIMRD